MAGTNNFLVFNEANNPDQTMSDADYALDNYRINGLIPMIADPVAHNKMYRQWSIMAAALGEVVSDANYDASDASLSDLKASLKATIEDVSEAKVNTRLTNLENWKSDITATPAEINILDGATLDTAELNILDGVTATTAEINVLDGVTATTSEINILNGVTADASEINILDGAAITTTELNYLSGAESNIQNQINSISGTLATPFPAWIKNTAYSVGDICICTGFDSYKYLECVEAGTSDATPPANSAVGQLITDNSAKWLVCDWRDSAPVGTIRQDLARRDGWLKLNGATINTADYPRLVSFLSSNSLIQAYTPTPAATDFTYGDANNDTVILPDLTDLFLQNGAAALTAKAAGLPNVSGTVGYLYSTQMIPSEASNYLNSTKALKWRDQNTNSQEATTSIVSGRVSMTNLDFNASRENSIYGNSTTVQPPAVTLIPCIKY